MTVTPESCNRIAEKILLEAEIVRAVIATLLPVNKRNQGGTFQTRQPKEASNDR